MTKGLPRVCTTLLLLLLGGTGSVPASAGDTGAIGVGDRAPAFELPRLEGPGTLSLSDFRGDWLYVDFWASWCKPCRKSFAWMNRMTDGAAPGDLRIVAVGLDRDRADAEAFLRRYPAAFPVVWDENWRTPERWGLGIMPSSYLVDPDGIVRFVHHGFREVDRKRLRQRLSRVIAREGDT